MYERTLWGGMLLASTAVLAALPGSATPRQSGIRPGSVGSPPPGKIRFNRDIRPILSENCFRCHGPDPGTRAAGLRLDRREALFGARPTGSPVVPGKPGASRLWARIAAVEPAQRMPPPASHKALNAEQKERVRRWITEGASWEPHWSFVAPTRPAVPAVSDARWVRNPVDAFILRGLDQKGLRPAPPADRRVLFRRVSLDLTGLPPEPADVERFVADRSPDAYEKAVDRLLASPRWGEHRGRYWLDAARYADTHGIHVDNYREIWPYRDWVIQAFNENKPFDQFTVEQIAGDLLPNPTLPQRVASGFHRCNITTNEGGSIPDEVDAMYQRDRVETTATVWLGLTAGCASCHDHKFDPISQKEFYQFVAFFKNTTQNAMDGNIADTPPTVVVPRDEDRARWSDLERTATELAARKEQRRKAAAGVVADWVGAERATGALDALEGPGQGPAYVLRDEATAPATGAVWGAGPAGARALHFAAKGSADLGAVGGLEGDRPFTLGVWVQLPAQEGSYAVAGRVDEAKDGPARGWLFEVNSRIPVFKLIGDGPADTILVRGSGSQRLTAGKWTHLCVTYDGSRRADGLLLFVDGRAERAEQPGDAVVKGSIRARGHLRVGTDGRRDFQGGALRDLRIYERELPGEEVLLVSRREEIRRQLALRMRAGDSNISPDLLLLYLHREDAEYQAATTQFAALERERQAIRRRSAVTHVMQERPDRTATARVLFRGRYDQPRDEVKAATPAALHTFPKEAPSNRLGLARWLVAAENPLMARVTVNRFWQELFGAGLVRTAEDFGIMGESPSHPELLDWLAVQFRESGWDVKAVYRMLVTSATYRQAAVTTPLKLERDPGNRLLSRGPRFRMDAEMLRDFALVASGSLSSRIGGPSVKPYQPTGVWEAVAMEGSNTRFYKQDTGENLYRRSMYWFWKRSAPPASMEIFNAPSRENCTVRRERTNTPLQALVTLNDPQWVEAARRLAERALHDASPDVDRRLDFITLRALSRVFDARERRISHTTLKGLLETYRSRPEDAKKLVSAGEAPADDRLPAADLAAWTMLASQVMNLDEALCK